ncbi:MAG: hypothetical protein KBS97_01030 [Firmicutes bacterium]|nr:hypothetical protein [Candidatus Fiminaster equi]
MRFKKPRGVLLGIGFGAFAIAAALFFLVPVICKDGFQYNGLNALIEGVKGLFTFNFANVLYTALVVLFVIAFAVLVIYLILVIKKKHAVHIITWLFSLVAIFGSYVFVSMYFLADIEFNGAVGKLLDSMLKADGQMLGKILSSVALAFAILSNVVLIVHVFVSLVAMMVTDQIEDYEEKVAAEKEEELQSKLAEYKANAPVTVVERAAEPVAVEVTSEQLIQEATFEERKAKEEKLFKECLDSGYFSEYEELEFPDALEGFDEEPVGELSVVEEKSSMIRKSSIHVGFTHE